MTTAVQHRRGTTAEHATFTGLEGEVTIDTTKDTAVIHDGSLAGGYPLAKENLANVSPSGLPTIDGASTASDDKFFIYDQSATTLKSITRAELNNAMEADALANVSITGGSINGTTIGASTASSGAFTTLSASSTATLNTLASSGATLTGGSINNMAIGASTASSGAFTTLAASGAVTLSGGTANGVAYLNGSKVLTTGSALTYNGTTFNVATGSQSLTNGAGSSADFEIAGNNNTVGYGGFLLRQNSSNQTLVYNRLDQPMIFGIASAEQMRLTSTGLGIGTSSPLAKLNVQADDTNTIARQIIVSGATSSNKRLYLGFNTSTNVGTIQAYEEAFGKRDLVLQPDSGNLGLGVTPSAWVSSVKAFDVGSSAASYYSGGITHNAYFDGADSRWEYKGTGPAIFYNIQGGLHAWYTAPSGTAGNAITFTQALTLDASGNLLLGSTSQINGERLSVVAGASNGVYFKNTSSANYTHLVWNAGTSGDNAFIAFGTESSYTGRGGITYNRAAGLISYNTTSDYRAKDIIGPVVESGALIDSVPVYMGKMKGATQERPMFIAHETPAYAHTGEKDAVDDDGNPVYQQMDASALIPVMWAELQSLRKRVAELEAR